MVQGLLDFRQNCDFLNNVRRIGRKPGFVHILSTFFLDVDKK